MDKSDRHPRISLAILAAGIGSRYGGLKQIAPLGPAGEILLDYAIYDAIQAGIDKVVFLIRPDMEALFRETIGNRFEKRVEVAYAYQRLVDPEFPDTYKWEERKKPWGTGHAILSCSQVIHEPFLVINADDFYGRSAYRTAVQFLIANLPSPETYGMVAYRLANTLSKHGTVARGICQANRDGLLTSVVEEFAIERTAVGIQSGKDPLHRTTRTGDEPVSMNFWAFTPSLFLHLADGFRQFLTGTSDLSAQEYMIPSVIQELIDRKTQTVRLLDSSDAWFGVTYPQDVPTVRESLATLARQGLYPTPLFE